VTDVTDPNAEDYSMFCNRHTDNFLTSRKFLLPQLLNQLDGRDYNSHANTGYRIRKKSRKENPTPPPALSLSLSLSLSPFLNPTTRRKTFTPS
jgi:hypothetical protein